MPKLVLLGTISRRLSLFASNYSLTFMVLYRIMNIYKKLYGEKDGKVGMAMYSLANAKCARGNFVYTCVIFRTPARLFIC